MNIKEYLNKYIIISEEPIGLAVRLVNTNDLRSVCVVDAEFNLVGTITDGDIRQGFLSGLSLSDSCGSIANASCFKEVQGEEVKLSRQNSNNHRLIPIVNGNYLVDLKMSKDGQLNVKTALIMAGGFGKRMGRLTTDTPKPMLPLNGKPILERIIWSLKSQNIEKILISVFFKSDKIKEYFGDGQNFGVSIKYLEEKSPMGTGGCLALLDKPQDLIVLNGDVITNLNFQNFAAFCHKLNADAGMVVKKHYIQNPFGVVEYDGFTLRNFQEKPIYRSVIATGIYYIREKCLENLNPKKRDMPDFLLEQKMDGKKIVIYPYEENYWIDVGHPNALKQASSLLET